MKQILFFALSIFAFLYSCGTNESKQTENTASKVDFEIIKTGVLHGAGEEGFSQEAVKVSNTDEFNQIQSKINSVNKEVEDGIISNESFFDEQMLVFVFDKVRGTSGYKFKVEHTLVQNDTITISAFSKKPDEPAASIMTQPFQLLKMEKMNKEINLIVTE